MYEDAKGRCIISLDESSTKHAEGLLSNRLRGRPSAVRVTKKNNKSPDICIYIFHMTFEKVYLCFVWLVHILQLRLLGLGHEVR